MTTTTADKGELLPCPFCGGEAKVVMRDVEPQGDSWYGKKEETFVLCGCGACLFDGYFHEGFGTNQTEAAIAAWNRRPTNEGQDGLTDEDKIDYSNPDGAVVWHLIERHADNWADIGQMMDSWRNAQIARHLSSKQAAPDAWQKTPRGWRRSASP